MHTHRIETLGGTGRQILPFMLGDPKERSPEDSHSGLVEAVSFNDRAYRRANQNDVNESRSALVKSLESEVWDRASYNHIFDGIEQETLDYFANLEMAPETCLLLNLFRQSDPKTASHSYAVAAITYVMGKAMGLDDVRLKSFVEGPLFHDYGKIGGPLKVLHKDGPLDDEQWNKYIVPHPEVGVKILREHNEVLRGLYGQGAVLITDDTLGEIFGHHIKKKRAKQVPGKRLDSYPIVPEDYVPTEFAQALHVCDSYQTMMFRRRGFTPREAIDDLVVKSFPSGCETNYEVRFVDLLIMLSRQNKRHPTDAGRGNPDRTHRR